MKTTQLKIAKYFLATIIAGIPFFISCEKEVISEPEKSTNNTQQVSNNSSNEKSLNGFELYFINNVRVSKSALKLNKDPEPGTEVIHLVKEDTTEIHYFTSYEILEKWANTIPDGLKLLKHLKLFDELAIKAQNEGVVDYFNQTGEVRKDFSEYLLSNEIYNYKDTTMKVIHLGQFFKAPNSYGPNIPIYTFPSVGSSFKNEISSHQAIGITPVVSLYNDTFWRNRLTTFFFLFYTSRSYAGYYYNDATESISTFF